MSAARWSIDSVLHPSDLTHSGESAFSHALVISLLCQARLTILHVQGAAPRSVPAGRFPGVRNTLVRWGVLEAGSSRSDVAEKLQVEIDKIKVKSHNPVAAIQDYADEEQADLLVLSTERRSGLARWIRPSVAERVSRRTRRMTLFLPHGARGFVSADTGDIELRRILVPVRSSPRRDGALEHAARAASLFGDDDGVAVHVLHVGDRFPHIEPPPEPGVAWHEERRHGELVEQIVTTAASLRAELIVMGMKARYDRRPSLAGTTTDHVLRQSPCALLAVPVD